MKCDCVKAAIGKGYIIQGGAYDEVKHDFVDIDDYYIPLSVKGGKERNGTIKLTIRFCPICGERIAK